jgi:hypothetical protein
MSRQFLTGIDLNKNELLNAAIQSLSTAPSSPVTGQIYFDTNAGNLRQWSGTQWLDYITSEAGGGYITSTTSDFNVSTGELSLNYSTIESTLTGDGFATTGDISTALSGYATETFVTGQGYITSAALSGYATETFVNSLIGDSTVDGTAGNTVSDRISSAISGLAPNYITSVGSNLSVTTGELDLGENVVITDATQTLSNKTIDGAIVTGTTSFRNGTFEGLTIDVSGIGTAHLIAADDLSLRATNDIVLYPGNDAGGGHTGKAYIHWGNDATSAHPEREIATVGTSQTFDSKTLTNTALGDDLDAQSAHRIVNLLDPSSAQDAATKAYVDSVASGLNVKESVVVASTADVPDLTNVTTVDLGTLEDGARVLLKDQADITQNGIYVYDLATTTLSRAADQLTPEKGDYVFVEQGTNAARGFIVTNITTMFPPGGVVWTQFSAAGEYSSGNGIDITGNTISVDLDGDSLSVSGSGLKANLSSTGGLDTDGGIYVIGGTGITVGSGGVALDTTNGYGVRKYAAANGLLTASGGQVTWTVTHNFGTQDVTVQMREVSSGALVEADVVMTDVNTVTITWASSNVSSNTYRVVIVG